MKQDKAIYQMGLLVAAVTLLGLVAIQQTVLNEARGVRKSIQELPAGLRKVIGI